MKTSVKRFSIVIGFLALLFVLVVNALVTRHQLASQVEAHDWVLRTQQVLLELSQIELLLTQAESGQRGFLYTNNEQYLSAYARATADLESHINRVAELTADNPVQRTRISQLRELAQHKFGELAETIQLHRAGNIDASQALV